MAMSWTQATHASRTHKSESTRAGSGSLDSERNDARCLPAGHQQALERGLDHLADVRQDSQQQVIWVVRHRLDDKADRALRRGPRTSTGTFPGKPRRELTREGRGLSTVGQDGGANRTCSVPAGFEALAAGQTIVLAAAAAAAAAESHCWYWEARPPIGPSSGAAAAAPATRPVAGASRVAPIAHGGRDPNASSSATWASRAVMSSAVRVTTSDPLARCSIRVTSTATL
eukprot:SAG22_NODE_340_length_12031_cov_9.961783_6_plen_229_part_00